ncbi:hypothetical protein ACHAW5_008922 [Stephanodiscus triporus]|uniref:Carrier domain-containing protein n=1 Tax=Stephanodiscus triporus TaxID=2934178 RepID=A0ABD3MV25_9STRA
MPTSTCERRKTEWTMEPRRRTFPLLAACRHLLQAERAHRWQGRRRGDPCRPSRPSARPYRREGGRVGSPLASDRRPRRPTIALTTSASTSTGGVALARLREGVAHRPPRARDIRDFSWASCVPLSSERRAVRARGGPAPLFRRPRRGSVQRADVEIRQRRREVQGLVLETGGDWSAFRDDECASRLTPFVGLVPSPEESGIFTLQESRLPHPRSSRSRGTAAPTRRRKLSLRERRREGTLYGPNGADDEVLVLFTSGTTGSKKLVPHVMGDMLTAAATIALSWDLSPSDVNCNLMPLFHVGGIVRQVFSPIFSGGCVICCPSFDPLIFWTLLEKGAFTWYYAAPTMHQLILQTGKSDGLIGDGGECAMKLRMIANAAGGLLPSLAKEMFQVFDATVLPSYGMTECMPITSPPSTYRLDKTGTSGVAVGPELAILNTATLQPLPPGEEGSICVRGEPCFRGYGKIANDDEHSESAGETFLEGGWFNTGDLGYMDADGYLFITGRSKEVINRGGEIISPMEVEEAAISHPDIVACAAFSALHNVLQEVVGIVVVMKVGRPRLDLLTLHEYLGERLAAPKWPQCIVFMDSLPRSHTNKILRVKLGARLQLPELSDDMNTTERTFEAMCPPQGTPLDVPIRAYRVNLYAIDIECQLTALLVKDWCQRLVVVPHSKRACAFVCYLVNIERTEAIKTAIRCMARYSVPTHFVEIDEITLTSKVLPTPNMTDAVATILQEEHPSRPVDPTVEGVKNLFTEILDLDYLPGPDASFFHLGGSSMLASQLASKIRKFFSVACSGSEVFQHASPNEMAKLICKRQRKDSQSISTFPSSQSQDDTTVDNKSLPFKSNRLNPQNTLGAALFQLVPLFVVFPIYQVSRYFLFMQALLWTIQHVSSFGLQMGRFVITSLVVHIIWIIVAPLVFVAMKWIIIGRYRAGRYPIWGSYYLRWWFVDVMRKIFGKGVWGSNDALLAIYYRMLGAKIGKGARIHLDADVAEFDLVEVGERAAIESSTLRGFGVDNGAMILGPVKVGNNGSLGIKSIVAPYTFIPDNCHLGPVTSSYDAIALDITNACVNRKCFPGPPLWMQLCIVGPIITLVNAVAQVPPLFVLFKMVEYKRGHNVNFLTTSGLMEWLVDPHRIPFYIGIGLARKLLSPFFYMTAAILVKKVVIGRFKAGPRDTSSYWQLLRHTLAATLFSRDRIQNVTDLIGRHYELVSVLYRLLGAKVGKRVFWPGQQPSFTGEFDLLEIGDDVVFGSRSAIFFTTTTTCEKVILCAGSNVADNCVVLPGSIVGKNAVLASNSLCPVGWYLPENSIWLGCKGCEPSCLEKGVDVELNGPIKTSEVQQEKLAMMGDISTLRPFGKAFYLRQAPYFVWTLAMFIGFTFITKTLIVTFHIFPLLLGIHSAAAYLYGWSFAERDYQGSIVSGGVLYSTILLMYIWTHLLRVVLWVVIELTAKWTLMGKRLEGRYNYDTSSYLQRWEIYQTIANGREFSHMNLMDFFCGTRFMSAFFRWNGAIIGKDCCLYPAGADPFMTEPDLVFMGSRCVIDRASIVCHLNTRGNFELAKIVIEEDCTLRNGSRVQQACHMEEGSQLLEKGLAMTGEIIEAFSVWQGSPASWWFQYDQQELASLAVQLSYGSHIAFVILRDLERNYTRTKHIVKTS